MPSTKTSAHKAGDKRFQLYCPDGWESEPMTYAQAENRLASLARGHQAGVKGLCPHEHSVVELER